MASPSKIDDAGRAIAGLLGYNPGPGIYSRLERAVQQMPANVRVEELPGLLKRYKEGVPGWELNETDLPGLIGDAKVIPRQDILDRVRERSPVFTHGEIALASRPLGQYSRNFRAKIGEAQPTYGTVFGSYGQGGDDYTELLITQPGAWGGNFGSHWSEVPGGRQAVAHARFDTHGDALRINELQSDLGIFNRRAREDGPGPVNALPPGDPTDAALRVGRPASPLPFPLEDAWSDILIKRLALEAAQKGHRAIEIASPRAIADKVGGNIDNYEHFYGKVVPGALERLGRKMGGLVDDTPGLPAYLGRPKWIDSNPLTTQLLHEREGYDLATGLNTVAADNRYKSLVRAFAEGDSKSQQDFSTLLHDALMEHELLSPADAASEMTRLMSLAGRHGDAQRGWGVAAYDNGPKAPVHAPPPGRRYIMSDEMRKRILTQGIGASLLAPVVMEGDE